VTMACWQNQPTEILFVLHLPWWWM